MMTEKSPQHQGPTVMRGGRDSVTGNHCDFHEPGSVVALDGRAALSQATEDRLRMIAMGAEHELIVAVSAADAMRELPPLLDRLLAEGQEARDEDLPEGWRDAHRRLLDTSVLSRVTELRHATGIPMDYAARATGDREAVLEWLVALRRLKARIVAHARMEPTIDGVDPADISFLWSMLDGSVDLLSEDVAGELEPMFEKYADVPEMMALFTKACDRFGEVVIAAANAALERSYPDLD